MIQASKMELGGHRGCGFKHVPVVRWMDLESVIQSEVSQKEKNKYRMLTHICGI